MNHAINRGQRASTILLVDDEPEILELVQTLLTMHDYQTRLAGSVDEAIAALHRYSDISLIILDLYLKGKDGTTLLVYLNDNLRFDHIPVLVCTGHAEDELVTHCIQLGVSGFLRKPFRSEALLQKVENAIARWNATILIADGDEARLFILSRMLKREGYQVVITTKLDQLPLLIDTKKANLVIIGDMTSNGDRKNLVSTVKSAYPDMPILTIRDSESGNDESLARDADGEILSPFFNTAVCRKLQETLTKARHQHGRSYLRR